MGLEASNPKEKAPTKLEREANNMITEAIEVTNEVTMRLREIDDSLSSGPLGLATIRQTLYDAHNALALQHELLCKQLGRLEGLLDFMPAIDSMGSGQGKDIQEKIKLQAAKTEALKNNLVKRMANIIATPVSEDIIGMAEAEDKDRSRDKEHSNNK